MKEKKQEKVRDGIYIWNDDMNLNKKKKKKKKAAGNDWENPTKKSCKISVGCVSPFGIL